MPQVLDLVMQAVELLLVLVLESLVCCAVSELLSSSKALSWA